MGKTRFDTIIGESAAMQRVFELIENVASTDINVLITGESGTGKELIARSIHDRSARRQQAFVPVMEFANGGTFFLDEVCELPVSLQAKLLRVLQDRQLRHLGGNELIQVDVRLISASNRDPEVARANGALRDDFYYRLNVINIHLQPLRERCEDILPLATHFLQETLKFSPKKIRGFNHEVMQRFERYRWPGNIRELENVVQRAITLAHSDLITLADLPAHFLQDVPELSEPKNGKLSLVQAKQMAIQQIERQYLLEMLVKHQGNVTKIAAESGMTRRNLHRLLNRHRLKAHEWRETSETV
ncbi:sigma 54-interacting transcriptional regulator [candidate division KSB1 bacterium]|nr:sigma 54-interacting transcriptional regulator [candidate division KSB1 bacterium]